MHRAEFAARARYNKKFTQFQDTLTKSNGMFDTWTELPATAVHTMGTR